MNIEKLFKPESIVIVGVSDKPGFGSGAAQNIVKGRNPERIYYINLKRDELFGKKCYHSLAELPEVVDCMILATPAKTVAGYLREAGELGIPAAIVFASGFSEERSESAKQMAAEVEEISRRYDIALCGPNCVGVVNAVDNICLSPKTNGMINMGTKKGIGVVAQSGYITNGFMVPDSTKLAYTVSAGNSTICSIEDYMLYLVKDERVNCVAAYIEGIHKPAVLVEALRTAADLHKPVVVLKAGMTEKGSFAAASHTGSLAGDYKTYESIFRKFGVILTQTLEEFVSTARMFSIMDGNFPKTDQIGAINFSGGENTLCADTCDRFQLKLPAFARETVNTVQGLLPSYATASNPLDATTTMFREKEKVHTLFTSISNDPGVGLIILGNDVGLQSEAKDITSSEVMSELKAAGQMVPAVVIPSSEQPRNQHVRDVFEHAGIPVLSTGVIAYRCVRHLFDFINYDSSQATLALALPEEKEYSQKIALSEGNSKTEIAGYGVRTPKQTLVSNPAQIKGVLNSEIPFPVVMKVDSADILHKTEAGGVKLNIQSLEEAEAVYQEISDSCAAYKPEAKINGILIQEMVPSGIEMIIGVKNDKQFGPMLLVGLGGVFVEIFKDTCLYPCPLNKTEAKNMLESLKGYKLLSGYRSSKPADIEALTDLMVQISEYAVANKDVLVEMDLNPVFLYEEGEGVCAADALIVKRI